MGEEPTDDESNVRAELGLACAGCTRPTQAVSVVKYSYKSCRQFSKVFDDIVFVIYF